MHKWKNYINKQLDFLKLILGLELKSQTVVGLQTAKAHLCVFLKPELPVRQRYFLFCILYTPFFFSCFLPRCDIWDALITEPHGTVSKLSQFYLNI